MDIVEKLRRQADSDEQAGTILAHEIGREAAAEIERLRAEAKRYRWLRDVGDATWRPFSLREGYGADMADQAIDAAILMTPNACSATYDV